MDLKKTRSFIDMNTGSDPRLGEDSTSDNGNLTPTQNKSPDLNLVKQRSQQPNGGRFSTFKQQKHNFSSFKKEHED